MRQPYIDTPKHPKEPVRWLLLLGALGTVAVSQVSYFWLISNRGFDLTDEGFYLLNYWHWSNTPIAGAFGAYFSPPFLLFGESVVATRWFGHLLVLCSTAGLAVMFVHWMQPQPSALQRWSAGLAGATLAPLFQFLVPHPLTPSYNTLAYVTTTAALAIAIHILVVARDFGRLSPFSLLAWGTVVGISLMNKFSTGTQILFWQGILLLCGLSMLGLRSRLPMAATLSIAGLLVQFGILYVLCPEILSLIRSGVEVYQAYRPRAPLREIGAFLGVGAQTLIRCWWVLLPSAALAALYWRTGHAGEDDAAAKDQAVWIFAAGTTFGSVATGDLVTWPWLWAVAVSALAYQQWQRRKCRLSLAIAAATLLMPFAYAFGTANNVHRQMAMALPILGVWTISCAIAWHAQKRLSSKYAIGTLALLALLATATQLRGWVMTRANYRLDTTIAQQTHWLPANPGNVRLRVDASMAEDMNRWVALTQSAGMPRGAAALEFTGHAPGLLALLAARPLGFLWLVGGASFDADAATVAALRNVTPQEVAGAWLVSSDDSDRRVRTWREQVTAKLDGFPYEMAGQTQISNPSTRDPLERITITLWRPLTEPKATKP